MGCKIRVKKILLQILDAIDNHKQLLKTQKHLLTESFLSQYSYKKYNNITENIVKSNRTRNQIYITTHTPSVILYESSVFNTPTLESLPVIQRVQKECDISNNDIYAEIHYDDLVIADHICFYIPKSISKNQLKLKLDTMNKIMTACGYFLAIEPEETISHDNITEYAILYEPNQPDWRKVFLPDILHHATSVTNSEEISNGGFIPSTNDQYKYQPRVYFTEYIDGRIILYTIRRHKQNLIKSGTTNQYEYADITIKVPKDVKFYYDTHMPNPVSYFTFDKISKEYIQDIQIKKINNMMSILQSL